MYKIARKVIETYLNEQKIPNTTELGIDGHEELQTKKLSFVTLYKKGKIIASSGRINLKKGDTIHELIENSLFCLKDSRFIEAIKNPLELKNVNIRVDLISPEQRKVVNSLEEIDLGKHGLILISQSLGKIGVILPNITNMVSSPEELFEIVCKKAELDKSTLNQDDYILYSIESEVFSDF